MTIMRRIIWTTLACTLIGVLTTGAVLWTQGYRVYVVHTGSMSPTATTAMRSARNLAPLLLSLAWAGSALGLW